MRSTIRSTVSCGRPQHVPRPPGVHQRLGDLGVDRLVHRRLARAHALDPARVVELRVALGRASRSLQGGESHRRRASARARSSWRHGPCVADERRDRVRRQQRRVVVDAADAAVAGAVVGLLRHPELVEVGRQPVGEAPVVGVRERRAREVRAGRARGAPSRGKRGTRRRRHEAARGQRPAPTCAERSMNLRRVSVWNLRKETVLGSEHARPSVGALTRRAGDAAADACRRSAQGGSDPPRRIASAAALKVVRPDGKNVHQLRLHRLRPRQPAVDGPLPGLRGVEHAGRGKGRRSPADRRPGSRTGARDGGSPRGRPSRASRCALAEVEAGDVERLRDRQRGARPRARRRPRAGLDRPDRRLARASARAP